MPVRVDLVGRSVDWSAYCVVCSFLAVAQAGNEIVVAAL